MTILSTTSPKFVHQINQVIDEQTILNNLGNLLVKQGLQVDKRSLVHFYVTLKSGKSLVLVGRAQSGKRTLVESAGRILTDSPRQQTQMMVGHAYWASQSQNITQFVKAQANWNRQRLMILLEEAVKPENANRLYIACLNQISPAELHHLFTSPGLPLFQESDPIPIPANFRLIGTMNTIHFPWWTPELLSHTAVIHWHPQRFKNSYHFPGLEIQHTGVGEIFLQTCIWHEQKAYARLLHLFADRLPFHWLIEVVSLLQDHGVFIPREAINQMVIFLANSWTQDDRGLFARSLAANLLATFDLALGQYILPWLAATNGTRSTLNRELRQLLDGRFLYTLAFLQTL